MLNQPNIGEPIAKSNQEMWDPISPWQRRARRREELARRETEVPQAAGPAAGEALPGNDGGVATPDQH
jgi:hypothetical protein